MVYTDKFYVLSPSDSDLDVFSPMTPSQSINDRQHPNHYSVNSASINDRFYRQNTLNTNNEKLMEEMKKKQMEYKEEILEQVNKQRIGYEIRLKAADDENKSMRNDLNEKNVIIKKLNEGYKLQKKKLIEEWIKEKSNLIEAYLE